MVRIISNDNKNYIIEEILAYGIARIKLPDDYFFKRISELKELCASEEDYDLSLESLKTIRTYAGTYCHPERNAV